MSMSQWRKMIILMINMFITIGSFGIIIPILPAYLESIGQGGTAAGLMVAIFAGAQLVFSPIAGKWTDQYGRKKMIVLGLIGLTVSMFIFYAFDSIWWLYASRVVGGIGSALLVPAIFAYIADITTIEQRAKGNSFISAAMSLGIVIGPGVGGFFADFGLKMPFLVATIVSLAAVIFSLTVLKESVEQQHTPEQKTQINDEPMLKKLVSSAHKPYFMLLIITLVMSFGLMAYESVIGLYMDDQFGATPQEIAWMVTLTGLISVIVQLFVVDKLVGRFGEGAVLNFFLGVVAIGFFLSLFADSYFLFFVITLLIFLATSILRPVLNTLISKMAGNEQGFAMGLNNAYMSIGNILGPMLAGILYDIQILYPFILGCILLVFTLFITVFWQNKSLKNTKLAKSKSSS